MARLRFLNSSYRDTAPDQATVVRFAEATGETWDMAMPRIVKSVQTGAVGELDVLAAPYGGHINGKDSHLQFFTPQTDFKETLIPFPPVFYYHGDDSGMHSEPIGQTVKRWVDEAGVWYRVVLDMTSSWAQRVWQAALAGNLYASTGVVTACHEVAPSGEIIRWLIGELSLIDADPAEDREPANYYALALPRVKSLVASLPDDQRRLFDDVYLDEDTPLPPQRSKSMWQEIAQALRNLLGMVEQASEDGVDPAAADDVADAVDAATDVVNDVMADADDSADDSADDDPTTKCASCGGTCGNKAALPVVKRKATKPVVKSAPINPQVTALETQVRQLQTEATARTDADWMTAQLRTGRLLPSERETMISTLAQARQADSRTKSGGHAMVTSVKKLIEERPALTSIGDENGELRLAGFESTNTQDTVDPKYMERMRKLAGIQKSGGA